MPSKCICSTCGKPFRKKLRYIADRNYCRPCRWPKVTLVAGEDGEFASIPIYRRDKSVAATMKIDADIAVWANQWSWSLSNGYPSRRTKEGGRSVLLYLHREILGLTPDDDIEVDHINRDKCDARRSNLRLATRAQQQQNVASRAGAKSRYRGVWWHAQNKNWCAEIRIDGKKMRLGSFATEEAAAEAARAARLRLMPYAID